MKYVALLTLFSMNISAEDKPLSAREQRQLLQEVQSLKQRVQVLEGKNGSATDEESAKKMLQTIQKGRSYQEAQQKALEELDKE